MLKLAFLLLALVVAPSLAHAQKWEQVAQSGVVRFVYIEPEGLKDRTFVAQVLDNIWQRWDKLNALQVLIFDDRDYTPNGFPMTDKQMPHWRARYAFNRATGLNQFVWITIVDRKASPPTFKETKADIRPGGP